MILATGDHFSITQMTNENQVGKSLYQPSGIG
jgi:hypothetical protein